MQDPIKDMFPPMFDAILQGELDSHLGYDANDHGYKDIRIQQIGEMVIPIKM